MDQLSFLQFLPLRSYRFNEVFHFKSHAFGLHDELFDIPLKQPLPVRSRSSGRFRDGGSHSRTRLEPSLLNEVLNDTMRGVGVDLELGCKRSDGWKGLSWSEFAADECFLRGVYNLIEDGFAGTQDEAE